MVSHLGAVESQFSLNIHFFGLWDETGVADEIPHRHDENMEAPDRKALGLSEI